MKKALAGVLVAALVGLSAAGAMADAVPYLQVYFDDASNGSYGETQAAQCGQADTPVYLYVVAQNFNCLLSGVEYQIAFPPGLMFVADSYPTVPGVTLNIGNSRDGNAVAWSLPRSGFEPLLIATIFAVWTGECYCQAGPLPIVVGPYPYPVDPRPKPVGVRWPDAVDISAVGMTSLVCPGVVSTTESTWGGIKALYR